MIFLIDNMVKRLYFVFVLCAMSSVFSFANDFGDASSELLSDSSRVYDIDEVVVVAQPKEIVNLRRQPLSSSVFDAHSLQLLGRDDLRQLSAFVPSFVMPEYGSRLTSSMYVRGIGSRVNSPSVGMYLDGMPVICKAAYNFHTYQIDRIDMLRGPQGTLYGMNTEGGLVRIFTKNPMKHRGTDINLGIGTDFNRKAEVAHYHRPSDNFAFSVAGFYKGHNGFHKNSLTGKRADDGNEAGGRLRMMYTPTADLTYDLIADYQYVNQNAFPYGMMDLVTDEVADPVSDKQGKYRRNMLNSAFKVAYDKNNFVFTSTTSYQYLSDFMQMDNDYMPMDLIFMTQRQLQNALTQEFTVKSTANNIWQHTTGLFGSYQWLKTDAPVFFGKDFTSRISNGVQTAMTNAIVGSMASQMMQMGMPAGAAMAAAQAAVERAGGISVNTDMSVPALFHSPTFNLGLFHESNIKLTNRLMATIGLRYDFSNVSLDYDTKAVMAMIAKVMGAESTNTLTSVLDDKVNDAYSQLLPKVALTYMLSDGIGDVYATVAKGYRAGGFNLQMFSDILQTELMANSQNAMRGDYDVPHTQEDYKNVNNTISYKPEESWNYEVGAHLNIFNNIIHADLSAYYMHIKNQQLSVMAGNYGFGRMMVNAGRSYSCGVEAALRGSAFADRLSWTLGYGYTHAVFKDYNDEIDGTIVSYKDNKVPFVPQHTFSASADYRINTNNESVRTVVVGANLTAQGKTYWDEANTYSENLYALLGAHVDVDTKFATFSLWSRNITDTRYNTFAFSSSASGSTKYFAQRGNPFQLGMDVRIHF